jgi:malic enzyme
VINSRTSQHRGAWRAEAAGRLSIPVFHDDQHGTAIVVLAALARGRLTADMTCGWSFPAPVRLVA